NSPQGVPGPTCVKRSFIAGVIMSRVYRSAEVSSNRVEGTAMATTSTATPKTGTTPAILGTDEARIDGRGKVSGQTKYTADFAKEGMLWAAFVASPYAHARIVSIDTSAARAMPGVRAVLTGADIGERFFGCVLKDWPVLAVDHVQF